MRDDGWLEAVLAGLVREFASWTFMIVVRDGGVGGKFSIEYVAFSRTNDEFRARVPADLARMIRNIEAQPGSGGAL